MQGEKYCVSFTAGYVLSSFALRGLDSADFVYEFFRKLPVTLWNLSCEAGRSFLYLVSDFLQKDIWTMNAGLLKLQTR